MQVGFGRRLRWRAMLGGALSLFVGISLLSLPTPAFAAYAYNGGPTQATIGAFVPNDSTPFAVQVTAPAGSGLPTGAALPAGVLYVKPRFSPLTKPGSTLNRGSVWNPVTKQWISEQDSSWSDFPTITVNPDGSLPTGPSSWFYMRYGDDGQTNDTGGASGGWYLFISMSIGVSGNTYNNTADLPESSLLASQTSTTGTHTISWVHAGASSGLGANVTVAATAVGSTSSVDECVRTEPNGVDDDLDGVIDNEGATGSFRMAVPASTTFDVRTGDANQNVVNGWTNLSSGPTDTDIALGASDMTPPSAGSGLQATSGFGKVHLTWNAASDNTGVTGYNIYRWADGSTLDVGNPNLVSATPPHVRIGTSTTTAFDDTTAAVGQTYHYEVRAFDAATNVGPRSNTADGVAIVNDTTPPSTTISGLPTSGVQAGPVTFSLSATDTQSGVASSYYTLDGSSATTYTVPTIVTGIGPHTLTYWSVDRSGNIETAHLASFSISAGPPLTTISGIPVGWSQTPVTFSLAATGDAAPFATYYALGGAGANLYSSPVQVSSEGTTVVSYRSTNSLAQAEATKTATVRIDMTPPSTSIAGLPPVGTPAAGAAHFTLSGTDNASGIAHIYYLMNSSNNTETYSTQVTVTKIGAQNLKYWAVDNAGNVEAQHVAAFIVVAGKSTSTITISATPTSVKLPKPFVLQGVLAPGALNDPCVVYVKKPGSARWSYSSNRLAYSVTGTGSNWWYRYTPKLRGTYQFYVGFVGDATRLASSSKVIKVTVK